MIGFPNQRQLLAVVPRLRDDSSVLRPRNAGASQSEISRDERLGGRLPALGVAPGEIHAANCSEARVAAERGAGKVEVRIEDILAVLSSGQTIIDDEREHYVARG